MSETGPNRLFQETSPYLLQHANNPVQWYPWGDDAFAESKESDRLMILSIGYSACHWCHVMENESFTDSGVAAIMNENYVSVKVDREERPDVDQVYMQAAYRITGSGGWPLNVITLPDGRPVYAGTYFQKEKWKQLLNYFAELYSSKPDLLLKQAKDIGDELGNAILGPEFKEGQSFNLLDIQDIHAGIIRKIDMDKGGMYGAPKFPMPVVLEFLLAHYALSGNTKSLDAVTISLKAMAAGGIYDQLGGGFCRYSTDADWRVPHFEKMLYDNAQLISLYAKAYKVTGRNDFEYVIRDTVEFLQREMLSQEGGFYSSLDADSEGEEGLYYLWSKGELDQLAGTDSAIICDFFHITDEGNWQTDKNILYRSPQDPIIPQALAKNDVAFSIIKKRLLNARSSRIRPSLDDKILTSWNAMMLTGLLDVYRALGDETYLALALKNASFLEKKILHKDFFISRNYKNAKANISGFLDDYAFLSEAFIQVYQVTFDEHWLYLARGIAAYAVEHFYDPVKKCFYFNSNKDASLIFRPTELTDNVIPASSSKMLMVLDMIGNYFDIAKYQEIVDEQLSLMKHQILKNPAFHAAWSQLIMNRVAPGAELVILGPKARLMLKEINKQYFPGILISGGEKEGTISHFGYKYKEGQSLIYVCRHGSCQKPVDNAIEAIKMLTTMHKQEKN